MNERLNVDSIYDHPQGLNTAFCLILSFPNSKAQAASSLRQIRILSFASNQPRLAHYHPAVSGTIASCSYSFRKKVAFPHLALFFGLAVSIVAVFAILAVHVAVNGCYAAENSRPGLRKLLPTA